MQAGWIHAVRLNVILPAVDTVGDLGQQLLADRASAVLDDRVEGGFQGGDAVAGGELLDAAGAETSGADLRIDVAAQVLGQARVALQDAEGGVVGAAAVVELDRRHDQAFLPHVGRVDGETAGHHAADVVVVAEDLAEPHEAFAEEDRQRGTQVGRVPGAAGAVVGVVPEEDVAGVDVLEAEVLEDGLHDGGVGATGELTAVGVEDGDAVVVLVADHGGTGRALDGGFDLQLGGTDRARDHLQLDRSLPSWQRRHAMRSSVRMPCGSACRVQA